MEDHERRRQPAIAEHLTCVALVAFGIFFVESLLAFFERAAQRGRCEKESEQ